ncbi:hypothetical protein D7S70_15850 [Ralstonia pickettii]|nr:hypothetical protein [Ralstonia pickettii]MBB0035951.1 hypothetical protein [Ralstonia pickettii]MBB0098491.1 hypothetical protein [Ralstonia pickettii]MBB0108450.1 hypothetical protein [Ralstonia pickettii]MBB0129265.1 hypothetical protein [Ralstonia pickettii]
MVFVRFILVVLISLAVPFVATAGIITSQATECSMQPSNDSMAAMTMHDCCDHGMLDKAKPHACKPGQECKVCSACAVVPAASASPLLPDASQVVIALPDSTLPSHDPRGLWRPPRSL